MDINSHNTFSNHILKKRGILKSFNINREISRKDFKELYKYLGINEDEVDDITKADIKNTISVISQMQYADSIPGLIAVNSIDKERVPKLFYLVSSIVEMIIEETKSEIECKFILAKVIKDLGF